MTLVIILVWVVLLVLFVMRNYSVYNYRMELLSRVSDAALNDIDNGRYNDWRWRYKELEDVDYFEHVLRFWKPVDSFYPRDPARLER